MSKAKADPNQKLRKDEYRGPVHLNRSRKWRYARTYQEAREYSPASHPVR